MIFIIERNWVFSHSEIQATIPSKHIVYEGYNHSMYQTEPKLKFLEVTRINHSVYEKSSKGGGGQRPGVLIERLLNPPHESSQSEPLREWKHLTQTHL